MQEASWCARQGFEPATWSRRTSNPQGLSDNAITNASGAHTIPIPKRAHYIADMDVINGQGCSNITHIGACNPGVANCPAIGVP